MERREREKKKNIVANFLNIYFCLQNDICVPDYIIKITKNYKMDRKLKSEVVVEQRASCVQERLARLKTGL